MSDLPKLTVYTQPGCSYCEILKIKIMEWGFDFEEVNINENVQGMAMMRVNNHKTVPQLYWNKKHVGPSSNDTMKFTRPMLMENLDLESYVGGVESFG